MGRFLHVRAAEELVTAPDSAGPGGESEDPDDAPRGWLRRDVRAAPIAVWAALVLHLLLLLVQLTLYPAYRGLDEPAHVSTVLTLPDPLDWPAPGALAIDDRLRATWDEAGWDGLPFARLAREDAPLPKEERPSFAEAGGTEKRRAQNHMVQHPPLYYLTTAAVLEAVPGTSTWPYDAQIALMRLLSALLVAPLPLLCWLAARRLDLGVAAGTSAAFVPLLMPSVQRVSASVSNDGLLLLLVVTASVLSLGVAGGDLRRRTAAALGLVTAAALLTKGLALALPVVVVAAYAVAALRSGHVKRARGPALLATGLAVGLAGWWYARNLVLHGAVQPNGYRGGGLPYEQDPGEGFAAWAPQFVDGMLFRFWSALGLPEPPALPEGLSQGLTVGLLVLAVLALLVAPGRRTLVAVALLPFLGLLALVAIGGYLNYAEYGRLIGVQGRYLYPGVAGVAAAAALALSRLAGPLARALPLALLAGAAALQLLAARVVLETYWTPADDEQAWAEGLAALTAWSPLHDEVVLALWSAVPLAALVTAVAAALLLRRPPASGEDAADGDAADGDDAADSSGVHAASAAPPAVAAEADQPDRRILRRAARR